MNKFIRIEPFVIRMNKNHMHPLEESCTLDRSMSVLGISDSSNPCRESQFNLVIKFGVG